MLERGVIVKITATGKSFFVAAVSSHGTDLVPCIGDGCQAEGWTAEMLQNTPHTTIYLHDPAYQAALASFAKQTTP
jgi:hypothetical protein